MAGEKGKRACVTAEQYERGAMRSRPESIIIPAHLEVVNVALFVVVRDACDGAALQPAKIVRRMTTSFEMAHASCREGQIEPNMRAFGELGSPRCARCMHAGPASVRRGSENGLR